MKEGQKLPSVNFQVRVRDESIGGDNPFRWQTFSTEDYFSNKRVVVFSLPGHTLQPVQHISCQDLRITTGQFVRI